MAAPQDTEITLGTGKMVAIFFGLVALCAVCFGAGYSMGKNSVTGPGPRTSGLAAGANSGSLRPSANPSAGSPDDASSKAQKNGPPPSHQAAQGKRSPDALDSSSPPLLTGYYVQVAAVSKQEDAEALVAALKSRNYTAFSAATPGDQLFHVQVGPFADIKDADQVRSRLVADGYNPILKR